MSFDINIDNIKWHGRASLSKPFWTATRITFVAMHSGLYLSFGKFIKYRLYLCFVVTLGCDYIFFSHMFPSFPVDTRRKLNVHKTGRPGRLLNVSCAFSLRPLSAGLLRLAKKVVLTYWLIIFFVSLKLRNSMRRKTFDEKTTLAPVFSVMTNVFMK